MKQKNLKIYADGGSRGNPGPAAAGYVITDAQGKILEEGGLYLGEATNNQAEYRALILSLEKAKKYQPQQIEFYMDSQLVVNQIEGRFKVKNVGLKPLVEEAKGLIAGFKSVSFEHVLRDLNELADEQVNIILDRAAKP